MKIERKVFDAHFHIGVHGTQLSVDGYVTPLKTEDEHSTYEDCQKYLRKNNIYGGLIVPTYISNQKAAFDYNKLIIEGLMNNEKDNIYGGLWVSPLNKIMEFTIDTLNGLPKKRVKALKMSANAWEGMSVSPSSWTKEIKSNMDFIIQKAIDFGLVIHFHTGERVNDVDKFDDFLTEYGSAIRIQFVHMGETLTGAFRFIPNFIKWLNKGYDIYCDTSMVPGFAVRWILKEIEVIEDGFDRLLFATDSPWESFLSEYWKIEDLKISEELKEKIFWRNFVHLYSIQDS